MKCFVVLAVLVAVASAKPGYGYVGTPVVSSLSYVVPGAPIGGDGRVVDTPEVAHAKAEHAAAHINEKVTLANEAVKSADVVAYAAPAVHHVAYAAPTVHHVAYSAPAVAAYSKVYSAAPIVSSYSAYAPAVAYGSYYSHGAPLGIDGRVVDTPEVAHAKAAHFAAHAEAKAQVGYGYAAYNAYAAPAW